MATNGTIKLPEIATPDTPDADKHRIYVGSDGTLKKVDDLGVVTTMLTDLTGQPLNSTLTTLATKTATNLTTKVFGITIDGGGSAITTGVKGYIQVPVAGTITEWTLLADQSGSIVIDLWKTTYASALPTALNTITAAAKPTLSSVTKNTSSTLTGWTTAVTAGDVIGFNVDSATTVTRVTLTVKMTVT